MRICRAALALICAVYVGLSPGSDGLNAAPATTAPNFPLIFYPPDADAQAGLVHDRQREKTLRDGLLPVRRGRSGQHLDQRRASGLLCATRLLAPQPVHGADQCHSL